MESKEVPEEELFLPHEREVLRGGWRDYFKVKRECWLATLQRCGNLWKLFVQVDELFLREISDLEKRPDPDKFLPQLLFIKSHQSIRVAAEVGFSTHFTQAYDLTRTAIEFAVHAHKIYRNPRLAEVWLSKDDGKKELDAFRDEFERNKKKNLFPDRYPFLVELHDLYGRFSDWGSHATVASLAQHYRKTEDANFHYYKITYTEADPQKITSSLYYLISAFSAIEKTFHDVFSARLSLDTQLQKMRARLDSDKAALAKAMVKEFKIEGPLIFVPKPPLLRPR